MKIKCPKCKNEIPTEDINISTDIALCKSCNETLKISDQFGSNVSYEASAIEEPPKGTWIYDQFNVVTMGSTTRHPIALFIIPFMCVWSGGSIGGIYGAQLATGEFNLMTSLFGIPFLIGSIIFWSIGLMTVIGKVEITIKDGILTVFTGVGSLGWKKTIDWNSVKLIKEESTNFNYPGSSRNLIILEGKDRIKFGSMINTKRSYFLLNALKYLQSKKS